MFVVMFLMGEKQFRSDPLPLGDAYWLLSRVQSCGWVATITPSTPTLRERVMRPMDLEKWVQTWEALIAPKPYTRTLREYSLS